ncbi:hypothetical protein [Cellvibrio sp. KY-YJ-3]|uniref:hypothetical protein n=1 Tax=Cellvibrio sp. KY-YJ-3 TaxID=454662 RepID=UPI0012440D59|nr:hypothetical protein [Cellvibrio sp. KY-YJ-3]QEY12972.1 hypothetical protein D0B88_12345 [Cellvibrio sp. KY-YJ-3]
MPVQLFNEYAIFFALGFLVIYVLAQLLVSKHPRFQALSAIQKSVTVKVIALSGFILVYVILNLFVE